jgi:hypothetical protein
MNEAALYVAFGLFVLVLLAVLVWPKRAGQPNDRERGGKPDFTAEDLAPRHAKYFPLVRQALDGSDLAGLAGRIPPRMRRTLRAERRTVARSYLRGLREDFERLERFGRMVAALSPTVDPRQEAERVRLGVRFRLVYAIVAMRLALGNVPVPAFERLTLLIGSLATRVETSMTALLEPSPPPARADLGA